MLPPVPCPWLWSKGTLPAYWPVCKFDLILVVPCVLTSITTPTLSFTSMHSYCLPNVCAFYKFCCHFAGSYFTQQLTILTRGQEPMARRSEQPIHRERPVVTQHPLHNCIDHLAAPSHIYATPRVETGQ